MSKLKAYIGSAPDEKGLADYYLKSEADKVIAELKAQKAQAEDDCAYWKMSEGNAANAMHETEEYAMQLYNELRHNKYKRCLLIAKWCFEKSYSTTLVKYDKESGYRLNFYDWWGNCWLALAEEPTWAKFLQIIHKEAK